MTPKLYVLEGCDRDQSYPLEHGTIYTVGRSPRNDIRVRDGAVSKYHLKIQRHSDKYYLTDLGSRNGTFVCGREIIPLTEVEVDEGVPIVIGMTILGVGEACVTHLRPFLDSIGISAEFHESGEPSRAQRVMTIKRNLKFVYDAIDILTNSKGVLEVSQKIVDHVFSLLRRLDRCAVILTDTRTGEVSKVIFRSRRSEESPETVYNRRVVEQALLLNKAVIISDSREEEDEDDEIRDTLKLMKIGSVMCVPMCSCLKTRGVIYMDSLEKPHGFRRTDLGLISDVCSRVAIAMECISLQDAYPS